MRKTRICITIGCCLFAVALLAWARSTRKPGLWEMTTTMKWQQSPMPPGMQAPPGSPFSGAPHTTQICLTQAMIDKYGAPVPQNHNGDCQIANVVMNATSMTADWICSGRMAGKGSLESRGPTPITPSEKCTLWGLCRPLQHHAHRVHNQFLVSIQRPRLRQRAAPTHA